MDKIKIKKYTFPYQMDFDSKSIWEKTMAQDIAVRNKTNTSKALSLTKTEYLNLLIVERARILFKEDIERRTAFGNQIIKMIEKTCRLRAKNKIKGLENFDPNQEPEQKEEDNSTDCFETIEIK